MEGRNPSWFKRVDEVLKFLADHGLIHVAIDCPWAPLVPAATSDWAVFRFHGRNVAGWELQKRGFQPTVAEKYEHLYDDAELDGLAQTPRAFHGKVRKVSVKFNNNFRDFPIQNALALKRRLGQEAPDPKRSRPPGSPPAACRGPGLDRPGRPPAVSVAASIPTLQCLPDDRQPLRPPFPAGKPSSTTRPAAETWLHPAQAEPGGPPGRRGGPQGGYRTRP